MISSEAIMRPSTDRMLRACSQCWPKTSSTNQPGRTSAGKDAFGEFLAHMNQCYAETVIEPAILVEPDGKRAAAEFMLDGQYLVSDDGLPEASGQSYLCVFAPSSR
jgi:hypothetical protein